MAFLIPDSTYQFKIGNDVLTVNVKITPDSARAIKDICSYIKKGQKVKPCVKLNNGTGKPKGITIHNTDLIKTANGTNPAEQYARATYPNGNMNGVAVHYWVYKREIWQQLSDCERGWHAADGETRRTSQRTGEMIGGNLDTISIEIIETGTDNETEDTAAKLIAYLLHKHELSPDTDIYTHTYFYSKKYCPAYILPHLNEFKAECKAYYNTLKEENKMKEYVVKEKGETLWSVAVMALGDGSRYPEIRKLNNLKSDTIYVGQVLKIPETETSNDHMLKLIQKEIEDYTTKVFVNELVNRIVKVLKKYE